VFSVISDQLTEPALESLLVVIRGEDGDCEGDDDEEVDDDDEEDDSEDEEENGEKENNSEVEEDEDEDDDDSEPEEEEKVGKHKLYFFPIVKKPRIMFTLW
jgi:stringent starvation protein B